MVRPDRPPPGVHLVGGDGAAELHQLGDGAARLGVAGLRLDLPDVLQLGEVGRDTVDQALCSAVSTTIATARESVRIQLICSADDVS